MTGLALVRCACCDDLLAVRPPQTALSVLREHYADHHPEPPQRWTPYVPPEPVDTHTLRNATGGPILAVRTGGPEPEPAKPSPDEWADAWKAVKTPVPVVLDRRDLITLSGQFRALSTALASAVEMMLAAIVAALLHLLRHRHRSADKYRYHYLNLYTCRCGARRTKRWYTDHTRPPDGWPEPWQRWQPPPDERTRP